MADERPYYGQEDTQPKLWHEYTLTDDYKMRGMKHAMSTVHELIKRKEAFGLKSIITIFVKKLSSEPNLKAVYAERTPDEWLTEWRKMHKLLFGEILKGHLVGRFRRVDVRFGNVGDEELHRIPAWQEVDRELRIFAMQISAELTHVDVRSLDSVCKYLAKVHYQFIRIHPFDDGNGRIARALTDQLGISMGLPPVIAGFPRTVAEKKRKYHNAITASATDSNYRALQNWIQYQVERKIEEIA